MGSTLTSRKSNQRLAEAAFKMLAGLHTPALAEPTQSWMFSTEQNDFISGAAKKPAFERVAELAMRLEASVDGMTDSARELA